MSFINTTTLFLQSTYRTSGTNQWPVFALPKPLVLSNVRNSWHAKLVMAEIPFSFSVLGSFNTVGYTFVTSAGINTSGTLTIPSGNYDINTLLSVLASKIQATIAVSASNPTLNFSYDTNSARVTLGLTSLPLTGSWSYQLTWTQADLLAPFFGFSYTANTVLSCSGGVLTSTNYVSPNAVNVNPVTSLVIRSDLLQQTSDQQEILVEAGWSSANILGKVLVTNNSNTWLFHQNDSFVVKLLNKSIESIDLYISTIDFNSVSLNGIAWRATLQLLEWEPRVVEFEREQQMIRALDNAERLNSLLDEHRVLKEKVNQNVSALRRRISPQVNQTPDAVPINQSEEEQ